MFMLNVIIMGVTIKFIMLNIIMLIVVATIFGQFGIQHNNK